MKNKLITKKIKFDIVLNNGKTIRCNWEYHFKLRSNEDEKIEAYNEAIEGINSYAKSILSGSIIPIGVGSRLGNIYIRSSDISEIKIKGKLK